MPKVVGIIQARMGSTRFPRKMTALLGNVPVIEWVMKRCGRTKLLNQLILATTINPEDDELVNVAREFGLEVFRGSVNDVLGRFNEAARIYGADAIVRICADNPFIDPGEIDRLVGYFLNNNYHYVCNHQNRLNSGYADGFGAEIFSRKVLEDIAREDLSELEREHITLHIWNNINKYKVKAIKAPSKLAYPNLQFDLDLFEDLEYLNLLVKKGVRLTMPASKIIRLAKSNNF